MRWEEIRSQYPHQWLLVEVIQAHSEANKRIVEEMTVVNVFPDSRLLSFESLNEDREQR